MEHTPLREQSVTEMVASIAGGSAAPGSRSAAALVLALAGASAHKSLAITRKHRPLSADQELATVHLTEILDRSLQAAERDAERFRVFLHDRDAATAHALMESDRAVLELAAELSGVLAEIEPGIHPIARSDLAAARILLTAAGELQALAAADNRQEAGERA
jgi:formiminotetrahydrofolate cyclodeaminase